jgi:hypothetical protein
MSEQPSKDEFFEAQVERALRPYRGRASAEELAALEEVVRDTLANDPVAVELLHAARPRATPQLSGDTQAPGAAERKDAKPTPSGKVK